MKKQAPSGAFPKILIFCLFLAFPLLFRHFSVSPSYHLRFTFVPSSF
ncbi:hypothetical protein [Bacteroides caecimuris]|nr:hypothetical protein [Bacteroides caecimuris]